MFQSFYPKLKVASEIPEDVQKVLSNSCVGCHSTDARSKDAREALDFEKWDEYRVTKKIGLLGDIGKLVDEDKMPPEKFLNSRPEKKLTPDQKKLVMEWAKKESDKLMKGN